MDARIRTYSEQDVSNWTRDLESLPQEIKVNVDLIHASESKQADLNPQLVSVKTELIPINNKIEAAESRLEILLNEEKIRAELQIIEANEIEMKLLMPQLTALASDASAQNNKVIKLAKSIEIKKNQEILEELNRKSRDCERKITQLEAEDSNIAWQLTTDSQRLLVIERQIQELERLMQPGFVNVPNSTYSGPGYPNVPQGAVPRYASTSQPIIVATANVTLANPREKTELDRLAHEKYSIINRRTILEYSQSTTQGALAKERQDLALYVTQIQVIRSKYSVEDQKAALEDSLSNLETNQANQIEIERMINSKYQVVKGRYDAFQRVVEHAHSRAQQLKSRNQNLLVKTGEFSAEQDKSVLESELRIATLAKKPLQEIRLKLQKEINDIEARIVEFRSKCLKLKSRLSIAENNDFLIQLRDSPERLLFDLLAAARKNILQYERKYPDRQSLTTRACLAVFEEKVKSILSQKSEEQPGLENNTFRNKYYQLSGLLWNMHDSINTTKTSSNPGPIDAILQSFGLAAVARDDALKAYNRLSQAIPLTHVTTIELQQYEENEFDKAYAAARNAFANALSQDKTKLDFQSRGNKVIELIFQYKEKIDADKFDIKFYTTILNETAKLAYFSQNSDPNYYSELALKESSGKSSWRKKIAGVMVSLFGLATLLLSGSLLIAPAHPLVPLAKPGLVIGASLFSFGAGLFYSGREKGIKKSMKELLTAQGQVSFSNTSKDVSIANEPVENDSELNLTRSIVPSMS